MFDINQRKLYPKSESRQTNTIKTQRKNKINKKRCEHEILQTNRSKIRYFKIICFLVQYMCAHSLNEYHTTVIGSYLKSEWSIKNQRIFQIMSCLRPMFSECVNILFLFRIKVWYMRHWWQCVYFDYYTIIWSYMSLCWLVYPDCVFLLFLRHRNFIILLRLFGFTALNIF